MLDGRQPSKSCQKWVAQEFADWIDEQVEEVNRQLGTNGGTKVSGVDITRWIVAVSPIISTVVIAPTLTAEEREDNRRKYMREYMKKYNTREDVKEKRRAYSKKYRLKPEVKEKAKDYAKRYRAKRALGIPSV